MYMRGSHEVANPDPHSGLYVRDRHGNVVKVALPPDHVAFQVGGGGGLPLPAQRLP